MKPPTKTRAARYPLTEANDAFALYLAKRFIQRYTLVRLGFADLVQEARLGMMAAEERHDPELGKFITYAGRYAWGYMQRAMNAFDDLIPVPASTRTNRLDIPPRRTIVSLDALPDAMDPAEVYEALQTLPPADTTPTLTRRDLERDITRGLRSLTDVQRNVLILRAAGLTLREIGGRLGVSRERVRQIQAAANTELKQRRNPMTTESRDKSEKLVQAEITRVFGCKHWLRLWRQNTGAAVPVWAVGKPNPQIIKFGIPGCADLTGILADGRRLEIEVKSATGQQSQQQRNFEAMITKLGGVYILARSVDDVSRGLTDAGFDPAAYAAA